VPVMLANLAAADGEVLGLLEALQSRRSAEAGLVAELPNPETGRMQVLAPPTVSTADACPCARRRRYCRRTPRTCSASSWAWIP
jgi:hypothetical protein